MKRIWAGISVLFMGGSMLCAVFAGEEHSPRQAPAVELAAASTTSVIAATAPQPRAEPAPAMVSIASSAPPYDATTALPVTRRAPARPRAHQTEHHDALSLAMREAVQNGRPPALAPNPY